MVDIIQEAKDEARLEAIQNFAKTYATQIAGVLIAIFVMVGGYSYWQNSKQQASEKAAVQFMTAMESFQTMSPERRKEEMKKLFDLPGYGLLAKFIYGTSILSGKNIQTDELTKEVDALLADSSIDDAVRDMFVVSLAQNLLSKQITLTKLNAELQRISNANSFLRAQALEILALNDISVGNKSSARAQLSKILNDANASRQSRERARILIRQVDSES